jgi:cation diffusion facilitator family transporter
MPSPPEHSREGAVTVFAAVALNLAIAAAKYVVAAVTGSSAILSEAIHSTVDTGDGLLLWIGLRRSTRAPDEQHPFGHGKELYFWSTVVAILVFAVGGGMSAYEGILHLLHPAPAHDLVWTYAVLGVSFAFEGISWTVAAREFRAARRGRGVWATVRQSKNPLVFTVLFEDSAALLGILIAGAGLTLAAVSGEPRFDGAASVLIGALLMAVAVLLARESRGLLIGEAVDPATLQEIRAVASEDPSVEAVGRALTAYFGPSTLVLNLELRFGRALRAEEVARSVARVERALRSRWPELTYIFIDGKLMLPEAAG